MIFDIPIGLMVIGVTGALYIIYRHISKIQRYNKQLFLRAWQMEVMLMYVAKESSPELQERIETFLDAIEPLD